MLSIILLLSSLAEAKNNYVLRGNAINSTSGKFAYNEIHYIEADEKNLNKQIQTLYKTAEGRVFATMTSDFSKDSLLPEITFEDKRFGLVQKQEVDKENKKIILTKGNEKQEIPIRADLVSGQGFDNFIKLNFDSKPNKDIPMSFIVLDKMDFFRFSLRNSSNSGSIKEFSLKIQSLFLKLFAGTISVKYDSEKKKLLHYEGLSNIADNDNKSQNVVINYTYEN